MPKLCPRYAKDMPKLCQIYAWDMLEICLRYSQDMPKICPRYAQDMPKKWPPVRRSWQNVFLTKRLSRSAWKKCRTNRSWQNVFLTKRQRRSWQNVFLTKCLPDKMSADQQELILTDFLLQSNIEPTTSGAQARRTRWLVWLRRRSIISDSAISLF